MWRRTTGSDQFIFTYQQFIIQSQIQFRISSESWTLFLLLQVNICQKHLFLHQRTHNMTTDFSLNYAFSTWKFQAQNMLRTCCVHKLFWMSKQKTNKKQFVYTTCSQHVLRLEFSCTGCKSIFRKIFEFKNWRESMFVLK